MGFSLQNKSIKLLLWVGIASISMFFAGLTSAYIVRKAEGNWTEFELPNWFLFSTIVICLSSFCLVKAKQKIKQKLLVRGEDETSLIETGTPDIHTTYWLFIALLLGCIFTFLQVKGWESLVQQGLYMTGEGSNVASSFLYVLTLSHLVHLTGGLIALLVTTINSKRGKYSPDNLLGIELTSIYWHYLTALWIYLFFFMQYI